MISLSRALRVIVAMGLTAIVLYQADAGSVLQAVERTRPGPLVGAVALVIADRALMWWRWVALLRTIDVPRRPPLMDVARVFFVSTFVGTFLPASIGGDAVRTVAVARLGVPAGGAAASVVLDRLLGVISILAMAAIGLMLARELLTNAAILAALVLTMAVSSAGLALIFSERAARLARFVSRAVPTEAGRRLSSDVVDIFRLHRHERRLLALVLIASIAVQVLRVLEAWVLGLALGIPAGIWTYFAFVPLILLIMLLPVTINGIGTSQAAFVWLFGSAGVDPGSSFALSLLFLALGVIGNLPGALMYATAPAVRRGHDVRNSA
ncbi:MAG TPA: lysylphosphatidylglycerol synthase transmembrane domain-containing protein [Vicinamibacterales bacterium]|nr:lysylphosphatidylglycerol synthase transmembrane domain-containing protein [Vicinamibacterales bacterium]